MKKEKQAESLQQLILEIALDFINLSPIKVDETINRALQKVGEFTGSARSYVFQLDRNNDKLRNSHEWCAAGIEPQMERLQSISIKNQSWYRERLLGGKTVFIEDIRKLPEKAKPVKEALMAQGIQSLVVVPMNYSNSQIGFVGFDAVAQKRRWSGAEIELLKVIADIFAHALVHRSLETKLYESQERYRLLVENLNDGIVISQNDKFIFFNRQFAEMLGYEYEELIMADYRQVYTTEGLKILEERARRRERGEEVPARYETIFRKKNGEHLFVEANVKIIEYQQAPATFAIISDITERKERERYQRKLEAELLKQQKMSSTVLFAGGIVHNLRNELAVIIGRAQLLKQKIPDLKEPDIIVANANKILQMADIFLKKANLEKIEKVIDIDLNDLIRTEVLFIKSNLYVKNQVDIHLETDRSIPPIRGYYIDFSHALSGIIDYSIHAMENAARRELRIGTKSDKKQILLTISHTGKPLSPEEMKTVFTPFYSVRQRGGKLPDEPDSIKTMQLYNAYILLERYGVKFQLETDAEEQTVFRLRIPVAE